MMDEKTVQVVGRAIWGARKHALSSTFAEAYTETQDMARASIKAHTDALAAAGFTIVPRDATPAMLNAGDEAQENAYRDHPEWDEAKDVIEDFDAAVIWRSMIAAAPDQR